MSEIAIAEEDPRAPESVAMIAALDAAMRALYPAESCHLLSPRQLVERAATFLVARRDGAAVGCVALVPLGDGTGELKRMWTAPDARKRGVARALCRALAERAARLGLSAIRLETGVLQPEAQALFLSEGFRERGPFGGYWDDPELVFMEKPIGAEDAA